MEPQAGKRQSEGSPAAAGLLGNLLDGSHGERLIHSLGLPLVSWGVTGAGSVSSQG